AEADVPTGLGYRVSSTGKPLRSPSRSRWFGDAWIGNVRCPCRSMIRALTPAFWWTFASAQTSSVSFCPLAATLGIMMSGQNFPAESFIHPEGSQPEYPKVSREATVAYQLSPTGINPTPGETL